MKLSLIVMLVLTSVVLLPAFSQARAAEVSPAQLQALKARIEKLSQTQHRELKERDSRRARLEETEQQVGKMARQRRALEEKVAKAKTRLQTVKAHQQELASQRQAQLDWLARTMRAVYERGSQPRIKLLLNQQDPARIARLLAYQRYVQQARSNRLAELDGELADLRQVADEVDHARAELLDRRTELATQEKQLKKAANERREALASLDQSISERGGNINRLRANEKRLEKLLAEVRRSNQAAGTTVPADTGNTAFGRLKGKLPWPVSGSISEPFHSQRQGALRWNGVVLAAHAGSPVRAVHSGRVVFANWMRGYGLLIIVDHGGGYLTLYGYNQTLLRDVGEWVATGDELALAGRSGGKANSGLYFEIRHNGKVVNPARWCSRRVTLPPLARND